MAAIKKTILVVDDDKSILRTFTRILQKSGYEIDTAETGKEAMEKTVRHIVKVADQFLIFEYFEPNPIHTLAAHCWLHDYMALFEAAGCEFIEAYQRPDSPQVLFHFRKKPVY